MSAALLMGDLAAVKSEPDLEKRSRLALDNGDKALNAAKDAFKKGDIGAMKAALQEVKESSELALESLKETGKHPSKNTKHYKRGELKTRQLQRRLDSFSQEVGFEDREIVQTVLRRV